MSYFNLVYSELNNYEKELKRLSILILHNIIHIYAIYGIFLNYRIIHLIICIIILVGFIIFKNCILTQYHNDNKNNLYKETFYYLGIKGDKRNMYVFILLLIIIIIDIYLLNKNIKY